MDHEQRRAEPGFVRDATAADAEAIGSLQLACWQQDYDWPEQVYQALGDEDLELQWARAVIAPPGPGHRVLVATSGHDETAPVVGFAALAPSGDDDAEPTTSEILAWEVHPRHRGLGHGTRLLSALADHSRGLGAREITIWIAPDDDARQHILRSSGLSPDGAYRELASDGDVHSIRQVRLGATL